MRARRYKKVKAGHWEQPIRHGYKMVCCDCGLVHNMDFRVQGGRAQFRAWRANGLTARERKRMAAALRRKR